MTEMTNQTGHGRIVVGVDGSAASKEALLWAAQQAEVTGASLEVVMVWEMPFTSFGRAIQVPGELDYAVEAEERLRPDSRRTRYLLRHSTVGTPNEVEDRRNGGTYHTNFGRDGEGGGDARCW